MKSFKTKIGISLTALTCFLMIGCATEAPEKKPKSDPDVMKVVETLKQLDKNIARHDYRYTLTDKEGCKTLVEFYFERLDNSLRLRLYDYEGSFANMSKSKYSKKVIIIDYNLDNLEGNDRIICDTYNQKESSFAFSNLSNEAQEELRKEYTLMIKEAPRRLLEQQKILKRSFEDNILEIVKQDPNYGYKRYMKEQEKERDN